MYDNEYQMYSSEAEREFQQARQKVFFQSIFNQFSGKSTDLLPFDEIKEKLGLLPSHAMGRKDIPLDKIVGSVGKYKDFTRSFMPRSEAIKERWKRIYAATRGMTGVPPIDVYKVGDVYFVIDGNHRVSVARQLGNKTIEANIYEFKSPVEVTADLDIDGLVLEAERARFLRTTQIKDYFPDADIEVTSGGYYSKLSEHIAVHGYFLGIEKKRDIPWEKAVKSWYTNIYMPLVMIIREHKILDDFPDRTETDLYLWIIEHRHYLAIDLGHEVDVQDAAIHFAEEYSQRLDRVIERTGSTLYDALTPDGLEHGASAGEWRKERVLPRKTNQLFSDILLPIDDVSCGSCQINQAIKIAQLENGHIYGIYVATSDEKADIAKKLRDKFAKQCEYANVPWKFFTEVGNPQRVIIERSYWMDLVVLHKKGPPASLAQTLFGPTFETVIQRGIRPVLAASDDVSNMERPMLAYDGSPKSKEALYVASHISKRWERSLLVICIEETKKQSTALLDEALQYLKEKDVVADGILLTGSPADQIVKVARSQKIDLLIMGSTAYSPFTNLFLRSTVDKILEDADFPILICR